MAEVFLAKAAGPKGFQKRVVVKRILPHLAEDQQFVDMFLAEATLAAGLDHPNIVQIFDFGEAGGQYYLAMEFIDGPNLRTLNHQARGMGQPPPLAVCAKIISHACEGLHFAHEAKHPDTGAPLGLIHRDISPDNILLSRAGAVKVVDFGVAKASTQVHRTRSGIIKGKMAYMPPEQLGRQVLDRRVDIFALGVVFYELVGGEMPFDATSEVSIIQAIMNAEPLPSITAKRADVPAELSRIIGRCLEKDRERRYGTCKELQADLERFLQSGGHAVHPHELSELVTRLDQTISAPEAKATPAHGERLEVDGLGGPELARTFPRDQGTEVTDPASALSGPDDPYGETRLRDPDEVGAPRLDRGPKAPPSTGAPARSRAPLAAALGVALAVGGLALLGGGGAYLLLREKPVVPSGPSPVPAVAEVPAFASPDASHAVAEGAEPERIGESPRHESDAAAQNSSASAAVAAAAPAPLRHPRKRPEKPVAPQPKVQASLEFRIRPYAQVYLDGKELGQTPLPPVELAAGKHTIRLVNAKLEKDVTVDFEVKAGEENVFKHNLKE
ncbi:MAG: protein kinase [Myxococcales bacterium]|nr:protein kinase [Myxococcales bacterium]